MRPSRARPRRWSRSSRSRRRSRPSALRDAVAAGLDLLGENRVQEAAAKVAEVPGARWHLVGPLQSNKARRAVEVFDAVQSVDSVELGGRLARLAEELRPGTRYPILLQVNVDGDPTKAGFAPDDLADARRPARRACRRSMSGA